MRCRLRLTTAYAARVLLWLLLVPYRSWVGLLRVICLMECWSSSTLAEHKAGRQAAASQTSTSTSRAKIIPFRRHTA